MFTLKSTVYIKVYIKEIVIFLFYVNCATTWWWPRKSAETCCSEHNEYAVFLFVVLVWI